MTNGSELPGSGPDDRDEVLPDNGDHRRRPAEIRIKGFDGIFEAGDHWQDGGLLCAVGRRRLSRLNCARHYVGGYGVRKWPLQSVIEIREIPVDDSLPGMVV